MATSGDLGDDGPSSPATAPPPPRRRLSMDEDLLYHKIMTAPLRRPSNPPPYVPESAPRLGRAKHAVTAQSNRSPVRQSDSLPTYSTSIAIEGVFAKKHEIEHTIKRAEDRQWHTVFVSLRGTALNIYNTKKDWGWGRTRDGPTISPDNPPWVRKAKLEKSYSLLYADAGIAADYKKLDDVLIANYPSSRRRYVIRLRAETDQFLLSCVELTTFVKWLELLFAAIDVAAPLDNRDFPRDMSVPRILRVRWVTGQSIMGIPVAQAQTYEATQDPQDDEDAERDAEQQVAGPASTETNREAERSSRDIEIGLERQIDQALTQEIGRTAGPSRSTAGPGPPLRMEPAHRLSTSSYPNDEVDQLSGKWYPEHRWSSDHDLLYAKLCYNNLLFRSPRKSNYIISQGKEWYVEWSTGKMVRVLPPGYDEIGDYVGPWQFVHTTENSRI
ncbi:hypothetical protein S40293_01949 [Stachybotrys chartarum IBT 40293]|nr:hypothetical protein S40293_01949 [Stachybotrys chartarum IBT 40293]